MLPSLPLDKIRLTSPLEGESGVSVTRETFFTFTEPLAASTVITSNNLYVSFGGQSLLTRIELSADRKTVTLFYLAPMPGSSRIRVTFDGTELSDFAGRPLDMTGTGQPGGVATVDFDTLSLTAIPNTSVYGRVFASTLQPVAGSTNQFVRRPPSVAAITVDGMEQTMRVVSDQFGNFSLGPVPAGDFFVHIDGRTVTNLAAGIRWPDMAYYPYVGKKWQSVAQQETNIGEIYLPLIPAGTLQPLNLTNNTVLSFSSNFVAQNPQFAGVSVTVPANDLYSDSGVRGGEVGIAPCRPRPPARPPAARTAPFWTWSRSRRTDHKISTRPWRRAFRIWMDWRRGPKSALWSFDHDTGNWLIEGINDRVCRRYKLVCTDPGVGIIKPNRAGTAPGRSGGAMGGNLVLGGTAPPSLLTRRGTQSRPPACPNPTCAVSWQSRSPRRAGLFVLRRILLRGRGHAHQGTGLRFFCLVAQIRSKVGPNTSQGNGWDCSYNVFIQQQGTNLVLFDGNSRSDVYAQQADGTWSKREFFRQFVQNPDGSYTMNFEDMGQWNFQAFDGSSTAGRLVSSVDRNGNQMSFAYDSSGRLHQVTDTLGRDILIAYNAQGYVATVTDFIGRVVSYEYYDGIEPGGSAGDFGKSVTTPAVTGTPDVQSTFPRARPPLTPIRRGLMMTG